MDSNAYRAQSDDEVTPLSGGAIGHRSVHEHVLVIAPGNLEFAMELSTNADVRLGAGTDAQRRSMRIVPGDTANAGRDDAADADSAVDQRTGTPAGQLPFPDAPVERDPEDNVNDPPGEMSDLAADDVRDSEVEASLAEEPEPEDVFAEHGEIAFEARVDRAQGDTHVSTPDGEQRLQSALVPDTALVEPVVEADESMGEASVGGAASTPALADYDLDPASPAGDDDPADDASKEEDGPRNPGAPRSEVAPEDLQ